MKMKKRYVNVRVNDDELRLIQRVAMRHILRPSVWVRQVAVQRAQQEEADVISTNV